MAAQSGVDQKGICQGVCRYTVITLRERLDVFVPVLFPNNKKTAHMMHGVVLPKDLHANHLISWISPSVFFLTLLSHKQLHDAPHYTPETSPKPT